MNPRHNKPPKYAAKSPKGKEKKKLARLPGSNSSKGSNKPAEVEHLSDEDLDAYLESPSRNEDNIDVENSPANNPVATGEENPEDSGNDSPSILRAALQGQRIQPSSSDDSKGVPKSVIVASPGKGNPNVSGSSETGSPSTTKPPSTSPQVAANREAPPAAASGSSENPGGAASARTRASPKRKQNVTEGASDDAVPLTSPSKIPKLDISAFGETTSPTSTGLVPEARQVTFLKNTLSLTSSVDSDETARNVEQPTVRSTELKQFPVVYSQGPSKVYSAQEDRYYHLGSNFAEKFRMISDVYQQFLAESLMHAVIAEALVGNLTRKHKVVPGGFKEESKEE